MLFSPGAEMLLSLGKRMLFPPSEWTLLSPSLRVLVSAKVGVTFSTGLGALFPLACFSFSARGRTRLSADAGAIPLVSTLFSPGTGAARLATSAGGVLSTLSSASCSVVSEHSEGVGISLSPVPSTDDDPAVFSLLRIADSTQPHKHKVKPRLTV